MVPISRKAIIVGASRVPGQKELPGVRVDTDRIVQFLLSDNGGAWEAHEIEILENPEAGPPAQALYHYVFFYFAGHGFTSDDDVYLCVNEHEDIPISRLSLPAQRQLVVFDACRTLLHGSLEETVRKVAGSRGLGYLDDYRARCRAKYDEAIGIAEKGRCIAFASAHDEAAQEHPVRGGNFTYSLVSEARRWANDRQNPRSILYVREAVDLAGAAMDPMLQNPEYYSGSRLNDFPFAVSP